MVTKQITEDEASILMFLDKGNKEAAFKILLSMYQERIYWHIRRMVTFHEDADDVVQNTFVKAFKNIDKFQRSSKLYTWLYRIATNESLTFLTKKKRNNEVGNEANLALLETQLTADQYFEGEQAELALQMALETLPKVQKAVFDLRYYEEMPYAEISEIMDTSVGALKASYHIAVKKIEAFIKEGRHEK